MVENRPGLTIFSHVVLLIGVAVIAFPLYVTFVASTLTLEQILSVPMPLLPGDHLLENYRQVLTAGSTKGSQAAVATMLVVEPYRGTDRLRRPVDRQVGQQPIAAEACLDPTGRHVPTGKC